MLEGSHSYLDKAIWLSVSHQCSSLILEIHTVQRLGVDAQQHKKKNAHSVAGNGATSLATSNAQQLAGYAVKFRTLLHVIITKLVLVYC